MLERNITAEWNVRRTGPEWDRWRNLPITELLMGFILVGLSRKLQPGYDYSLARTAVLFAACSLVILYGFFRNPYTPFYCYAFSTPIFPTFGTSFALILGGALLVWLHRKRTGWRWQFSWVGLAFCLLCVISLAWAERVYLEPDGFLIQTIPVMFLAFIVAGIPSSLFRWNMVLLIAGACVIGSAFSLRHYWLGLTEFEGGFRTYSLIRPDFFSAWLLFGIFGALAALWQPRVVWWLRGLLICSLPACLVGIVLCSYRAALVAVVVGLAVFCLCQRRKLRGLMPVFGVLATALFVYVLQPDIFNPVLSRFRTIPQDHGSERLELWQAGLDAFEDSPIWGLGLDGFRGAADRRLGKNAPPHSIYVEVLVELGVVGLGLMCCWFFILLRKAWRSEERLLLFPLLTVFLTQSVFLHEFQISCFWVVLGLAEGAVVTAEASRAVQAGWSKEHRGAPILIHGPGVRSNRVPPRGRPQLNSPAPLTNGYAGR